MKNNIILIFIILTTCFSSCSYLDFDESVGYTNQNEVYAMWVRAEQSLTNVYSYLDDDFGSIGGGTRDCATDDAQYVWTNCTVNSFNDGKWSALNVIDSKWSKYYEAIRVANQFIFCMNEVDFSKYEYNNDYEAWKEKSSYWISEARFLRSFFLFELAIRYGDIPLAIDIYDLNNVNTLKKTSFKEVIKYIVDECTDVAESLPVSYMNVVGKQTGRVTKGAALALKSRALLYAASPLYSENSDEKWINAAKAAKEIIDMGAYSLVDEESVNNINSKELIFERRLSSAASFEKLNFPISFDKANTGTCPTQNLVDAFQTVNGYDVTLTENGWQSDDPMFDSSKPYSNRDKRFYKTVIYDGSVFKGRTMQCYEGGYEGSPVVGASKTGYYLKKYVMESINLTPVATPKIHTWVFFRYAEVLLNYAEAMNEVYGPDASGEFDMTAREAVNVVRQRAAMPEVALDIVDKDAFRRVIQREKRVEFALEGHRFWDIRRWKIAPETQQNIYGVNIVLNDNNTKSYSKVLVENRKWENKKYFYPIPQTEIYKNNNLTQNLGW